MDVIHADNKSFRGKSSGTDYAGPCNRNTFGFQNVVLIFGIRDTRSGLRWLPLVAGKLVLLTLLIRSNSRL